jgi:urease accessory protein
MRAGDGSSHGAALLPVLIMRATTIIRRQAVDQDRIVDVITLDHGDRHRRRISLTADGGTSFLLDLQEAEMLDDGDAIGLDSGWLVEVKAAEERLIEVRASGTPELLTLALHIGNRHVPAEIAGDAIYIGYDHVLLHMLNGLGAMTNIVERAFRPVRGAYHHESSNHHGHSHG